MATLRLGAFADQIKGKAGNTVFIRTAGGISARDYVIPRNPQTPKQMEARARFAQASRLWNELLPDQARLWRAYAETLGIREPGSGAVRAPRAQNVFIGLASKLLQLDPAATIPLTPPTTRFFGDAVSLSVSATAGQVVFTANRANSPGVVTELLLQPVRSGASSPGLKAYRTAALVAFASGSLSFPVPVPGGWYACAYRFVDASTGQDSGLAECGLVLVT